MDYPTPVSCEVCHKPCIPVPCSYNVPSSEWYCQQDYRSYAMKSQDALYFLALEQQRSRKN